MLLWCFVYIYIIYLATSASPSLTNEAHSKIVSYLTRLNKNEVIAVGVQLGLSYTRLEGSSNFRHDMVTKWLRKDGSVMEPSWNNLCKALEACDHTGIALDIRRYGIVGLMY